MPNSHAHDAGTLLRERLKAKRGPVVCDCGIAAELSPESDVWQCRKRNCRFIHSVAETIEAPENHELPKRDWEDVKVPEKKPVGHPPWLIEACHKCGYSLETMKPGEIEGFRLFVQWFNQRYTSGLNSDAVDKLWGTFTEQAAKERK